MKFQRSWMTGLVVAVVSLTSGGWLLAGAGTGESAFESARLLEEVHQLLSTRYVEEISPSELYQMAIDGMLKELGDPYTSFLDRDDWADLQLSTTGNYGGLGIRIESKDGWITVVTVIPNTPAEREGLMTGDRIVEVEGETAQNWTSEKAVQVLRGPKGAAVTIGVARLGMDRPIRFTITRDEIHVVSVRAFMLENDVGYVRLSNFSREAREELRAAIDDLQEQGASSLLLDIRMNPGGLLEEGIAVTDLFLPRGVEVVATKSRLADQNHVYVSPTGEVYEGLPLAVLVNDWSASASEIVAGALQDHDRALIIGTTTFGKGSVQTLYGLRGGNHLKVTTAKWYTPSGRSIQREFGQPSVADVMAGAVTVGGEPVAMEVDTTSREVFHTAAGRAVYGGGGITPDLIVMPDTLTTDEQKFRNALVESGVSLRDAAFRFGVQWTNDHPDLTPEFVVGAPMRAAFLEYLVDEGAEVDADLFARSYGFVDWLLGREVANSSFGEAARHYRSLKRDRQIEEALTLLARADSPDALLSLAKARSAETSVAPESNSDY